MNKKTIAIVAISSIIIIIGIIVMVVLRTSKNKETTSQQTPSAVNQQNQIQTAPSVNEDTRTGGEESTIQENSSFEQNPIAATGQNYATITKKIEETLGIQPQAPTGNYSLKNIRIWTGVTSGATLDYKTSNGKSFSLYISNAFGTAQLGKPTKVSQINNRNIQIWEFPDKEKTLTIAYFHKEIKEDGEDFKYTITSDQLNSREIQDVIKNIP